VRSHARACTYARAWARVRGTHASHASARSDHVSFEATACQMGNTFMRYDGARGRRVHACVCACVRARIRPGLVCGHAAPNMGRAMRHHDACECARASGTQNEGPVAGTSHAPIDPLMLKHGIAVRVCRSARV
jgi:hypothetical protein